MNDNLKELDNLKLKYDDIKKENGYLKEENKELKKENNFLKSLIDGIYVRYEIARDFITSRFNNKNDSKQKISNVKEILTRDDISKNKDIEIQKRKKRGR